MLTEINREFRPTTERLSSSSRDRGLERVGWNIAGRLPVMSVDSAELPPMQAIGQNVVW